MGEREAGEDRPGAAARSQPQESEAARQLPGLPGLESEPRPQPGLPLHLNSLIFTSWSS